MLQKIQPARYAVSVRVVLATLIVAVCMPWCLSAAGREAPWARLRFKTAWLFLGDIDLATTTWATVVRHAVRGESANPARIPKPGEIIEITGPSQLAIIGYGRNGERDRLVPPTGRALTNEDLTGITLPAGALVEVYDVERDRIINGTGQGIWVRVGPTTQSR